MIAKLKGTIKEIRDDYLILDVGGVGYRVENLAPFRLGLEKNVVELEIYTYVTDKDLRLFGFGSYNERLIFEKLLQVSGVGPKSAMALVSTFSVRQIKESIENNDQDRLKVKGIGKKTIAKIIIELKGKLDNINIISDKEVNDKKGGNKAKRRLEQSIENFEQMEDLISALESLGYKNKKIMKIIDKIDINASFSKQMKKALSLL